MTEKEKLLEKLKKIKELAESGSDGERETAKGFLERLMLENNISEQDLSNEEVKQFEIVFERDKPFTERLLSQIVYSVVGDLDESKGLREYVIQRKHRMCLLATDAEYLEIIAKYEFYVRHLADDLDLFFRAFVYRNNIYPPEELSSHRDSTEEETPVDYLKVAKMSVGLDKHNFLKQIGGGERQ